MCGVLRTAYSLVHGFAPIARSDHDRHLYFVSKILQEAGSVVEIESDFEGLDFVRESCVRLCHFIQREIFQNVVFHFSSSLKRCLVFSQVRIFVHCSI